MKDASISMMMMMFRRVIAPQRITHIAHRSKNERTMTDAYFFAKVDEQSFVDDSPSEKSASVNRVKKLFWS